MQAIVPVASWASVWSTRSAISCPGTSSPRSRCSSRIVRAREAIPESIPKPSPQRCQTPQHNRHGRSTTPAYGRFLGVRHCDGSVTQERADALDRVEVAALAEHSDRPAVRQRLVHCEVEAVRALLQRGAIERTRARLGGEAPAGGALPGAPVGSLLEEQHLDPLVRSRLQRLRPARGGPAVSTCLLAPALGDRFFLLGTPALEQRLDRLQELCGTGVRLSRGPADDGVPRLFRQSFLELRARLLGTHNHKPGLALLPHLPVEQHRDVSQVVLNQLLDVPLVARLRPAALIVAARLLVEPLLQLFEPAVPQPVEVPALAPDKGDEHALARADQRHERSEIKRARDLGYVRNAVAERQRPPEPVDPGGEDRKSVRSLAAELGVEEGAQPFQVRVQPPLLVMRQLTAPRPLLNLVESGIDA